MTLLSTIYHHSGQADSKQGLFKRMDCRGKHNQPTESQRFSLVGLHNYQQSSSSLEGRGMCMTIALCVALQMSKAAPTTAGFPVWLQPEGTLTTVTAATVILSHCLQCASSSWLNSLWFESIHSSSEWMWTQDTAHCFHRLSDLLLCFCRGNSWALYSSSG